MAEVACRGTEELFDLVKRVRALPGVQRTETYPYFKLLRQQFRWTNGGDAPVPSEARAFAARRQSSTRWTGC